MAARRRIDPDAGAQALRQWAQEQGTSDDEPAGAGSGADSASPTDRAARRRMTATAVRYTLEELAACAPGRSVEVRVPPFGVTQAVAGTVHRRGTPPSVVETDAATWLALATGRLTWQDALADGACTPPASAATCPPTCPWSGSPDRHRPKLQNRPGAASILKFWSMCGAGWGLRALLIAAPRPRR